MRTAALLTAISCASLAALIGCGQDDVPEQLEALTISISSGGSGAAGSGALQATGGATVTGEGRDFHLDVGAGALALDLHLPGMSDLSIIDGRDVTVTITQETGAYVERVTMTIDDADGPLFVATNAPGANAAIGWGEVVAEETLDGVVWGYTAVAMQHDAGTASAMPGDVVVATLEGTDWRVVPHAAYRVEDASGQQSDCILPADVLGFEMLRVNAAVEPEPVVRPAALSMVRPSGCS